MSLDNPSLDRAPTKWMPMIADDSFDGVYLRSVRHSRSAGQRVFPTHDAYPCLAGLSNVPTNRYDSVMRTSAIVPLLNALISSNASRMSMM